MLLKDIESISKRISKIEKTVRSGNKEHKAEFDLLTILLENLNKGILIKNIELTEDQKKLLKSISPLTSKPTLYVANIKEDDLYDDDKNIYLQELKKWSEKNNEKVLSLCTKFEMEIVDLSQEEKKEFLNSYSLDRTGLDRLTAATFKLLGLETFFTAGEKEIKSWTVKKGKDQKKDELYFFLAGLDQVNWGNKDPEECLGSALNGVMPMPDFDPTGDQDYSKCVGQEKKVGW